MIFGINSTRDISKLSQITYNNFEISLVEFYAKELYAKIFQVNDIRENLPPHVENARRKPQT